MDSISGVFFTALRYVVLQVPDESTTFAEKYLTVPGSKDSPNVSLTEVSSLKLLISAQSREVAITVQVSMLELSSQVPKRLADASVTAATPSREFAS